MADLYHLVLRSTWEACPHEDYRAASLDSEGFIHCSYANQVAASANRFYAEAKDLLALRIDPARLTCPLRAEAATSGEIFPHIYGPLNRQAVVSVQPLQRDADGKWQFHEG